MKAAPALVATLAALAMLAACKKPDTGPRAETPPEGREETRGIRNTEAIGYAGDAIGDKVDQALDAADDAKRRLDEAEAAQTR